MSHTPKLRDSDYRIAADLMRALSGATGVAEFRSLLFAGLEKAFPGTIQTLNAVGQPEGTIFAMREGQEVHDGYAAEMPDLWPAQAALLDQPPATDRLFASTLSRHAPPAGCEAEQACTAFFGKLKVDDAAALQLWRGHEYLGLVVVNSLNLPAEDKLRIEDFLEFVGPAIGAGYHAVTQRALLADMASGLAGALERAGHGTCVLDRQGLFQAASPLAAKLIRSLGYTSGRALRAEIAAWLKAIPNDAVTASPMYAATAAGQVEMQFLRRMGDRDGRLNWFLAAIRTGAPAPQLSAREIEVAALVAEGLKDAAIAMRLHISPFTVRRHVASALAKLGLNNRAALSAWYSQRLVVPGIA